MKRVCIVTGTRAEYGILRPLIQRLNYDEKIELQIIVTGMHLSPEFGLTYEYIEDDGVKITEKVEILLSSDTNVGIAKSMGLTLISFGEVYGRLKPDMVIILGDRFETFAAMAAATVSKLLIAHIHGGEITEGACDDAFRHSMTKMSYLHFTSTEEYRDRVIQLGEESSRVFNVGAMGVENVIALPILSKRKILKKLNISSVKNYFVIVFHPVTLENEAALLQIKELFDAIQEFKEYDYIFVKGNSDTNGREINKAIEDFIKKNSGYVFTSLKNEEYLGLLKHSKCLIGNSSSGIIEAPSFRIPTVNIGDRQRGRVRATTVIDCETTSKAIKDAIKIALSKEFLVTLKKSKNPYGNGISSQKIYEVIKVFLFDKTIELKKKFHDRDKGRN